MTLPAQRTQPKSTALHALTQPTDSNRERETRE